MPNIIIELTDTQHKALLSDIKDVDFYLTSLIVGRADHFIDEIVKKEVERALAAGEAIPASRDEIVQQAYDKGTVKTAEQREDEAKAASETGVDVPDTIKQRRNWLIRKSSNARWQ